VEREVSGAWKHRCSLQGGVSTGLQQDAERTRKLFAFFPVQGLEYALHIRGMKAEDPVQDFASVWREPDADGAAVVEIPHPLNQALDLHAVDAVRDGPRGDQRRLEQGRSRQFVRFARPA
jgi:hypothetical protein